jgi:DNA-binding NtrC family response regulator
LKYNGFHFFLPWQTFCLGVGQRGEDGILERGNPMARILVIEDDEEMRSLLEDFLKDEGYEADSANNGSEAFHKLAQEPFDLLITDIRMPGLTGLDILSAVKKFQLEMPVIVITAFGGEEVYRRSMVRGADGYLEKPVHFHKLRSLIHELISPKEKMEGGCGKDMTCS